MCRGNELDVDEEYDNDGTLAMYESRAKKGDKEQQVKREKARQVSDYRYVVMGAVLRYHMTGKSQSIWESVWYVLGYTCGTLNQTPA